MEDKYLVHYRRLIKKRTVSKEVSDLNDILTIDKLDKIDDKADSKRQKYMLFQTKETARGLPFIRNMYERLFQTIMFEESYYPPNQDSIDSRKFD